MYISGPYPMKALHTQEVRTPIPSSVGIGSAGDSFAWYCGDGSHTMTRWSPAGAGQVHLPGWPHSPSLPLDLRQCSLRLGQPEGHLHGPVQVYGSRQLSTGLLPLTGRGIQRAEATVTVGHERAHAEFVGQGASLLRVGCSLYGFQRLAPCRNGAKEAQGICLVTTFL